MRSASSGSADRSAICVTFNLPRENAVNLQNMAQSGAGRLRELGVLAVQVGNTAAVSVQSVAENACRSMHRADTGDQRQQTLNATRANIAHYLGADISSLSSVTGSGNSSAENNLQKNAVCPPNVLATASAWTGIAVDPDVNTVAESSPHIVNLLQHDHVSSRAACLSSSMTLSSAGDVRPRKRARRRTSSVAAEVSVPLSMSGTADYANNAYSFQQPSGYVHSVTGVSPPCNLPVEQFKVPESRRRKACSSRKTAAAKSRQMSVVAQAPSDNSANMFNTQFGDCSKSSDVGMFRTAGPYSVGDGSQMNGVTPYHRIPVVTAGWQSYPARSMPPNSLYQSLNAAAPYPSEYGRPQFHFAGNVDYSRVTASANRMAGVGGGYHNAVPGSSAVFVCAANQMYSKEKHVPSAVSKQSQTLRWQTAGESQSYGSSSSSLVPDVHEVYMTQDQSGSLPASHVMQRQFVPAHLDTLPTSDGSEPHAETVSSASDKVLHLSVSSSIDRIKNMSVYDGAPSIGSPSGAHTNVQPSVTCQRVNGIFADLHSSVLAFREHGAHVKMNGDIEGLQHAEHQVCEKSCAVTLCGSVASSVQSCAGNSNCVLERQLQQPSTQLPIKVQQCGSAGFESVGVNGCSASTMPNTPKLSVSSGMLPCHSFKLFNTVRKLSKQYVS